MNNPTGLDLYYIFFVCQLYWEAVGFTSEEWVLRLIENKSHLSE